MTVSVPDYNIDSNKTLNPFIAQNLMVTTNLHTCSLVVRVRIDNAN